MTNTSTNAIIIDRQAFIINFLNETVWVPPHPRPSPEAKGHKLTCKIDKVSYCLESLWRGIRTGHFSPLNDSVQLWACSDPGDEWVSLKTGGRSQAEAFQWHPQGWGLTGDLMWNWVFFGSRWCGCSDGERKGVPPLLPWRVTNQTLVLKHQWFSFWY